MENNKEMKSGGQFRKSLGQKHDPQKPTKTGGAETGKGPPERTTGSLKTTRGPRPGAHRAASTGLPPLGIALPILRTLGREKHKSDIKEQVSEWLQTSQQQYWMPGSEGGRPSKFKENDLQLRLLYPATVKGDHGWKTF